MRDSAITENYQREALRGNPLAIALLKRRAARLAGTPIEEPAIEPSVEATTTPPRQLFDEPEAAQAVFSPTPQADLEQARVEDESLLDYAFRDIPDCDAKCDDDVPF